ncbi:MAG: anthranilate phosphoribosyltransferase [Myxococcales bacterium]|nr:anthranilate phosphoribosyltransferase [Myxococcales bacterium]
MIGQALRSVSAGQELSRDEIRAVIGAIMAGEGDDLQIAALLAALHTRGETLEEVIGAAQAMRDHAIKLPEAPPDAVDTCGTGGDGAGTFNISTVAAIVVAGAGVPVAKHGNRAATSRCGSAEVLEALGISLELAPARMAAAVTEVGIGFLFARACHPAMARVGPIRARLGIPTLFNRVGPLTNPMHVRHQLVGVADPGLMQPTVRALHALGVEGAWVVHGQDGLDELSTCAPSEICFERDGEIVRQTLEPGKLVPRARPEDLKGGEATENAAIARAILAGEPGPRRDVVLLNAGAALCAAGAEPDLPGALERAGDAVDSGRARDLLERWTAFTRREGAGK